MNISHRSLLGAVLICILTVLAPSLKGQQQIEPCGNGGYHVHKMQTDAGYRQSILDAEELARTWIEKNPELLKDNSGDKLVIPVVFHVVYNMNKADIEKISYEQIVSQVEQLNRDFNRYNRDRVRTRSIFDSIAGSMDLVFALATKDPNGNPTTGVTYTSTKALGFDIGTNSGGYVRLDSLKSTTGGGKSAWSTDKYLNVWVAHLTYFGGDGLYGIATFPSSMPSNEVAGQSPPNPLLEGVAMFYPTIGLNINANGDTIFNGRTITHEVGHWLGLRHIWGDTQSGQCDSSDYVDDTPQARANANFNCNLNINECQNENAYWDGKNPPNMVENFMDYSGDLCYNMFSNGQISRMNSFLNTDRAGLWQNTAAGGKKKTEYKAWGYTEPVSGCTSDCDGKIEIIAQRGNAPYTYLVDGEIASDKVENMCAGLHRILVIDASNQVISFDLVVGEGNYRAPKYSKSKTNATCFSCADGKAKVTISKGRNPITVTWDVNPVFTGNQITNCAPGWYRFTITDGCAMQYTDSVLVSSPAGIAELKASEYQLFPNPATSDITLQLSEPAELSSINILNVAGSMIQSKSTKGFVTEINLPVSDLAAGIYLIELVDTQGSKKTLQFVKQ